MPGHFELTVNLLGVKFKEVLGQWLIVAEHLNHSVHVTRIAQVDQTDAASRLFDRLLVDEHLRRLQLLTTGSQTAAKLSRQYIEHALVEEFECVSQE